MSQKIFKATILCSIISVSILFPLNASSQTNQAPSQAIKIQQFSAPYDGEKVTANLPIYKVHAENGVLVDDSGNVFNSYLPQTTTPINNCSCIIRNKGWLAYYTTFYVVLVNDPTHMYLVKSCGKSPLQLNSLSQYPNISDQNFINHGQIAGTSNGITANPVIAAGEIDIINGKIVYMDTCSGHFKPNVGSLLAYMSQLDSSKAVALTSSLKDIISGGWITSQQINDNLIFMRNSGGDLTPKRDVRSGTSNGYSYTTVFTYSTSSQGTTTLSGGLLAYQQGNINVFQNDINTITNKNIKGIKLTNNIGFSNYAAYVTTDLHFHNNNLQFYFTDESPDTYGLYIFSYIHNHAVDYDSKKPNINIITFH